MNKASFDFKKNEKYIHRERERERKNKYYENVCVRVGLPLIEVV